MRVVWVTTELSAVPRSGGSLRTMRLLQAISHANEVIVLLAGELRGDSRQFLQVSGAQELRIYGRNGRVSSRWRAWRGKLPIEGAAIRTKEIVDGLELASHTADVVVFDHSSAISLLSASSALRNLLNMHNVEAERLREMARSQPGLRKVEMLVDSRRMRLLEDSAVTNPQVTVVAVSARDRAQVDGNARVISNGTDLPGIIPNLPPQGPLVFVGGLNYEPNFQAVEFWASQVWTLDLGVDMTLTVVGQASTAARSALSRYPGIRLIGEVASVAEHLSQARVVVVPLRAGGGTRLKVLEAMAWARPIVTTRKGAEGIPLQDGVSCLFADTSAELRSAVVRLRNDYRLSRALGLAARELAEEFSWEKIGKEFAALVGDASESLATGCAEPLP